jgi:hypothetical protein
VRPEGLGKYISIRSIKVKRKAILMTGRGILYDYLTSRIPHVLSNGLTDDVMVVSFTLRPGKLHRKIPGTHFC